MAGFRPGAEIGVYRIVRPLGEGGMGAVYEVEHTQLGVHYALKTFSLAEENYVDILKNKFLAEGKVLARLHDPHIVRVAFCGHIHSGDHAPHELVNAENRKTVLHNVSRLGEEYQIKYEPLVLES